MTRQLEREGRRHRGLLDPIPPRGAQHHLELDLVAREALRVELVEPELLQRHDLQVGRHLGDPVELEGARDHVPLPVALRVEERVRDCDRHLVPHLGRAQRIGVDQDV